MALNKSLRFYLTVVATTVIYSGIAKSEDISSSMKEASKALGSLKNYMTSEEIFIKPENQAAISSLLKTLQKNFHGLESFPTSYHKQPGFNANLTLLTDKLLKISKRFDQGEKEYALWQLRTVPNICMTCHISYKSALQFKDTNTDLSKLSPKDKGAYLFATRNFAGAREAYWQAVTEQLDSVGRNDALRKWLVLSTRSTQTLADTIQKLQELSKNQELKTMDREVLERWILDLQSWDHSKDKDTKSLPLAEKLIENAQKTLPEGGIDSAAVPALRATAMLHDQLENGTLNAQERLRALLALGRGYLMIPLYLYDGLGRMYLEQVILEGPHSNEAKKAFYIYEQGILLEYSGNGGLHLPEDEHQHLEDLRAKMTNS